VPFRLLPAPGVASSWQEALLIRCNADMTACLAQIRELTETIQRHVMANAAAGSA